MAKSLYVLEPNSDPNSNGDWKEITNFEYKIGNQYRTIRNGWILHSGTWKQFYRGIPPFEPNTLELVEVERLSDRPVDEPLKFGDAIRYETNVVSGGNNEASRVDRVLYYTKYKSTQGQSAFESSDWEVVGSRETVAPYTKKVTFSRGDKTLDIFEYQVKARVYYEGGEFVETAPKTVQVNDENLPTTLDVSTTQPTSNQSELSIDAYNGDGLQSIVVKQEVTDGSGAVVESVIVDKISVNSQSFVEVRTYPHSFPEYRYKVYAYALADNNETIAVTGPPPIDASNYFSGPSISFSDAEVRTKHDTEKSFNVTVTSQGGLLSSDPIVSIIDQGGNPVPTGDIEADEVLIVVNGSTSNTRYDISYKWNPSLAGQYIEATFTAQDTSGNQVSNTITLIGEGDAPALVAPSGTATYNGGTKTLQIAQVDEADLTGITLSAQVLQGPATDNDLIIDNDNGTVGLDITEAGDYTVDVNATRNYATSTKTPTISVSESSLPAPEVTDYRINNGGLEGFTNGQIGYTVLFLEASNDPIYETVSESQATNSQFQLIQDPFRLQFDVNQPEGTIDDIVSYDITIEGQSNLSQYGFSVQQTTRGVELSAVNGIVKNNSFGRFDNTLYYGDDVFAANTGVDLSQYPLEDQRYKLNFVITITNVDGATYTARFTLAVAGGQTWSGGGNSPSDSPTLI